MIDIAPIQMMAARDVIQLVDEIAVVVAGVQMNQQFHRCDRG